MKLDKERADPPRENCSPPNLYNMIGNLQNDLGRNEAAMTSYERGRDAALKWVAQKPLDAGRQRALAIICTATSACDSTKPVNRCRQ